MCRFLRAAEEVGWEDTNHLPSATVAFNVCNPRTLKIEPGIIFSRFPNMVDCCRKALFAMLLGRIRALLPSDAALRDGRLIPRQWALPKQAALLKEDFEAATAAAKASGATKPIYIIKPDHGCQGAGIELSTNPCKTSPYAREAVVQEYIANPMLLGGLKFDLRLYVLVTSVGGDADGGLLRAFLCREGMARFAVQAFDGAKLGNVHAHLTNYSLNKKASGFRATDEADGGDGSKRTASAVFAALAASGQIADVEALWQRIGELVARSLSVVQPVLASTRRNWPDNPCFQVLGIDVLLDDSGAPWLLEMNDHPSLRIDRPHVVGKHKSRRRAPSPERVATGAEVDAPSTAETAVSEAAEAAARIPMPSERPPASPSSPSRAPPSSTRLYDDCYLEELTDLSAVDEAIKVPMLADVLRILGEVHGLPYAERRGAAAERLAALGAPPAGFAYGTSFVEVQFPPGELALTRLFDRLRVFFDWYMAEAADGTPSFHSSASRKPIDSQVFPGHAGGRPASPTFSTRVRRSRRRRATASSRASAARVARWASLISPTSAQRQRGGSTLVAAEAAPPRRRGNSEVSVRTMSLQRTRRRWSSSHAYSTHGRSGRAASSWHEWRGYIRYNRGRYSHFSTYVHTEL